MNTITFNEILSRLTSNPNVETIEIHRTNSYCGCSKPGDIVAVTAITKTMDGLRCALQRCFDEHPTIHLERFFISSEGERIYTGKEKNYLYAI